jgi:hypothetical protein
MPSMQQQAAELIDELVASTALELDIKNCVDFGLSNAPKENR